VELDEIEKILSHSEQHLTIETDHGKSIVQYLVELGFCDLDKDRVVAFIPYTIVVCQYVYFRMTLRK